ncbi:PH domain-containing protein [Anaerovibrio sp.]|uniref:PH domain-containing protein n=1 Tax=Anaerovibrio sp. TaxID=1872532 RepID=UPI003F14BB36
MKYEVFYSQCKQLGVTKLINANVENADLLYDMLSDDEKICYVTQGILNGKFGDGIIALTNKRIVFVKKGKTETILRSSIVSFNYEKSLFKGDIILNCSYGKVRFGIVPAKIAKDFYDKLSKVMASPDTYIPEKVLVAPSYSEDNNSAINTKAKAVLGCGFLLIVILAGFLFLVSSCGSSVSLSPMEQKIKSAGISDNLTDEQAKEIAEALKKCGFNDIVEIKKDPDLDDMTGAGEKGYRLNLGYPFHNFIVYLSPNNSVYQLRWANRDFMVNGEVLKRRETFVLTDQEEAEIRIKTKELVKSVLTVPESADFSWTWDIDKDEENIVVRSSVKSVNAFNVEFKNNFEVVYDSSGQNIKSFILGGKKII